MSETTPTEWARAKLSKLRAYSTGADRDVLVWTRRALPVVSPGATAAAWLGVWCNGGVRENTRGWITGSEAERAAAVANRRTPISVRDGDNYTATANVWPNTGFDELGVGGLEGSSSGWRGVVPAPGSRWEQSGSWKAPGMAEAPFRRVVGRGIDMTPGDWRSIPDQTVGAMVNNLRHGLGVNAGLPESLRVRLGPEGVPTEWSQWFFVCATMGWSAGDGGARRHLGRWPELGAVPESVRFAAWLRRVCEVEPGRARSHSNIFHSARRTLEKLRGGAEAVQFTGESAAFTAVDVGPDVERRIVWGANGGGGAAPPVSPSSSGPASAVGGAAVGVLGTVGRVLGVLGLVGVIGAGAWWLTRGTETEMEV